jgi:hypothetical protein
LHVEGGTKAQKCNSMKNKKKLPKTDQIRHIYETVSGIGELGVMLDATVLILNE